MIDLILLYHAIFLVFSAIVIFLFPLGIIAYIRFTPGDFKDALLYVILTFIVAGISFLFRSLGIFFDIHESTSYVIDELLYVFAILFAAISLYQFYRFAKKYGLRGGKR